MKKKWYIRNAITAADPLSREQLDNEFAKIELAIQNAGFIDAPGDHSALSGRDAANQHPIAAITDLQTQLSALGNHATLTNRDAANQHPMFAITGLVEEQTNQNDRLTALEEGALPDEWDSGDDSAWGAGSDLAWNTITRLEDHGDLIGRDAANQHPIAAITGLAAEQATQNNRLTALESTPVITNHAGLTGRDAANQHPIAAITGLAAEQTTQNNRLTALENQPGSLLFAFGKETDYGIGTIGVSGITLDFSGTQYSSDTDSLVWAGNECTILDAGYYYITINFGLIATGSTNPRLLFISLVYQLGIAEQWGLVTPSDVVWSEGCFSTIGYFSTNDQLSVEVSGNSGNTPFHADTLVRVSEFNVVRLS